RPPVRRAAPTTSPWRSYASCRITPANSSTRTRPWSTSDAPPSRERASAAEVERRADAEIEGVGHRPSCGGRCRADPAELGPDPEAAAARGTVVLHAGEELVADRGREQAAPEAASIRATFF